jgi:hypothetical protein
MQNHNWHNDTIKKLKRVSLEHLLFIREDAYTAHKVGDGWNPKAGQYLDEYYYCCMELRRRGYNPLNMRLNTK